MNPFLCKFRILFSFATFAVVVFAASSFAGTYYVAVNGSDEATGDITSPWRTLAFALQSSGPGDTVLIRAGVYDEAVIRFRGFPQRRKVRPGLRQRRTARTRGMPPRTPQRMPQRQPVGHAAGNGKYWVIKAYPGEEVTLITSSHLRIQTSYVRVEGIHFKDTGIGMGGGRFGGGHIQIVGNRFTGSGFRYGAVSVLGDSNLVEGNVLEIDKQMGTLDHGIYVHSGKDNVIRNNYISGMQGYGVHVFYQQKGGGQAVAPIRNLVIENNVITGSKQRSGIVVAVGRSTTTVENVLIRNNLIFANQGTGIDIRSNVRDVKIYNNTIYGNHMGGITLGMLGQNVHPIENVMIKNNIIQIETSTGSANEKEFGHIYVNEENVQAGSVTAANNLSWPAPFRKADGLIRTNNLEAPPQFVDAEQNDFRLGPGSAAIDAGANLGFPFAGKAPDVGAIETDFPYLNDVFVTGFFASFVSNVVQLSWRTLSEKENVGFEIERVQPEAQEAFETVGFVPGKGPGAVVYEYGFLDENLKPGTYVYRLKIVDKKGNFRYTKKIKIQIDNLAIRTSTKSAISN